LLRYRAATVYPKALTRTSHLTVTAVRGEIAVLGVVNAHLRLLGGSLKDRPCAVSRNRRWPDVFIQHHQEISSVLLTSFINRSRLLSSIG
jgi:hypothetical protein